MGLARLPYHHIFPQSEREWFEARGLNIDEYTIQLEQAVHEAIHKMGWNNRVMSQMEQAEADAGRTLTPEEILSIGEQVMADERWAVTVTDWADGWQQRLEAELRRRALGSLRNLAVVTSGQSLRKVSDRLGRAFAPVQIEVAMANNARRDGWSGWFARDMLVRSIDYACPAGWSSASTSQFERIRALAAWSAAVASIMTSEDVRLASSRLLAEALPGWEPSGPDDPLIVKVVQFSS
jgi:hypothetical protein